MAMRPKDARKTSYRLVAIPGTPNQLVLGLKWRTVLGEDLQKVALQAARARATHYVQSDARSSSVGLLTARGRESRAKTRANLFSGAAAFAQIHRHGTHVVACALPDQTIWFAVVVDGIVQAGGDVIFPDETKAQPTVIDAAARYRDLQVHSNYLPQARPFSLLQLTAHTNLQSALRRASFTLSMVSPLWWGLLTLIMGYEIWNFGSAWWQQGQARIQDQIQAIEPERDAGSLWQHAIDTWARTVKTAGEGGLTKLLNLLLEVPVEPGRWRLVEIDCQPVSSVCMARYRRTRLADNHTLRAALPTAWRIEHVDLDTTTATWSLPESLAARALNLQEMPTPNAIQTLWEPSWQAVNPALQDFTLSPPGKVQIVVPNLRLPDGLEQPVSIPKGTLLPGGRVLVINAPLRSLYGLALPSTTEISQLQVRHTLDATPGLNVSAFSATLKGTIYVQLP